MRKEFPFEQRFNASIIEWNLDSISLTPRESEILEEVARHGLSGKHLATSLGISSETLKNHLTSIYWAFAVNLPPNTEGHAKGLPRLIASMIENGYLKYLPNIPESNWVIAKKAIRRPKIQKPSPDGKVESVLLAKYASLPTIIFAETTPIASFLGIKTDGQNIQDVNYVYETFNAMVRAVGLSPVEVRSASAVLRHLAYPSQKRRPLEMSLTIEDVKKLITDNALESLDGFETPFYRKVARALFAPDIQNMQAAAL